MGKHLVLAGGGHAHLTVLARLGELTSRGHRVTLVSPGPYHYYSGMAPGMLSGFYAPNLTRFHLRKMVQNRGAAFVEDRVVGIDAPRRRLQLASGGGLDYDVVSFNTGSAVPPGVFSSEDPSVFAVKPIENLLALRHNLLEWPKNVPVNLLVAGGGPAGVEMAGALCRLTETLGVRATLTLVCGQGLLPETGVRTRRLVRRSLERRGVRILEQGRVEALDNGVARLNGGVCLEYNYAVMAVGVKPHSVFEDSGLPVGQDGGLIVNDFLQSVAFPELFGGGDCIHFSRHPLARVGVHAVRQNAILFHNLRASLEGGDLRPFRPQKRFMLIFNLGDGTAVLQRGRWSLNGRLAFWVKDWIDRRFMRAFQLSGERQESNNHPG